MNCLDADQGRADFLAGKRDEARYNDASNGADYRRGWQLARLGYIADQPRPEPNPQAFAPEPLADDPPWDDAPVVRSQTEQSHPAEAVTPAAPAPRIEPKGHTQQDVRLAAGEDKPKKSKPAPAGQLDLFG